MGHPVEAATPKQATPVCAGSEITRYTLWPAHSSTHTILTAALLSADHLCHTCRDGQKIDGGHHLQAQGKALRSQARALYQLNH